MSGMSDFGFLVRVVLYFVMTCIVARVAHRYFSLDEAASIVVGVFWPFILVAGLGTALLVALFKLIVFFL